MGILEVLEDILLELLVAFLFFLRSAKKKGLRPQPEPRQDSDLSRRKEKQKPEPDQRTNTRRKEKQDGTRMQYI